ncbi:helix-turn-helix domain-containing protein [Kitasatospora sp. NPDC085464]|uniref:AraC-like ligand-binding domain-containing protein n=1 Tax=Kitasatospora sp. NPDC085464 TaxID=3364063 RepID=UPI0037C8473D
MPYHHLDSSAVEPGHRFEWWCEMVARDVAPTRITTEHADDFPATVGTLALGPGQHLTTMSFPSIRSERTPALIRRSDPEVYELALIRGSAMWIAQGDNETRMRSGDLVMWNTSRPFDGRGLPGGVSRAVILHLPAAELPLHHRRLDRLLASSASARGGVGGVLAAFLRGLVREAPAVAEHEAVRLGIAARELAVAFLAHRLGVEDRLPPEPRHRMLLARIDAFIEENLGDPDLSPTAIAARHHISLRTLHGLFHREQRGGVAAVVRRRRLERCRADLADPGLAVVPVHAIAARWGFRAAAAFSRAFRDEYGTTASDFRASAGAGVATSRSGR